MEFAVDKHDMECVLDLNVSAHLRDTAKRIATEDRALVCSLKTCSC